MKKKLLDLPEYPFVAIGVDPGGTTGVSAFIVTEDSIHQDQFAQWGDPDTVWQQLENMADHYVKHGHRVVFIVEQFDKRPGIADPDFTPRFIINDINRYMGHRMIFWQIPSAAKNLVKPAHRDAVDGLKRFGWYQVGNGHANDASRHVIVFMVETMKHLPTILRGWPRPNG